MEVVANNYMPGDQRLIQQLVYELKSQGIFDQFRKECIADVDTKPAYQNLRQRVEGSVTSFLKQQTWRPDMNKNQVREQLRKSIYESGYLETGVERIVDQVVNPKINTVFLPQVEDVVYRYLGIEKPIRTEIKKELKIDVTDLLPTDLEAVSPESDHMGRKDDNINLNDSLNTDSKTEDESPPFEPIDVQQQSFVQHEENSVDSHLSGFSGLQSHDSNPCTDTKLAELSNQDSHVSHNSSESYLSIITSEENTKMEICEDSELKIMKSNESDETKIEISVETYTNFESKSLQNELEEVKKNEETDSDKKVEQKKPEEKRSEDKKVAEKRYEDKKIDEKKTEVKKVDDKKYEDKKADEKKYEVKKVDEKKYEDKKVDEKKYEDKKVDEKKNEDKKYDRKSDDKKSRSSDKHSSSKDKKDDKKIDKYKKSNSRSSGNSSSKDKEKTSSKHSSSSSYKDKTKDKKEVRSNSSSSKEKEKSDKEKVEKEKDRSDKGKEKGEKDKGKSSSGGSSKHTSSSSKDKEKSIKKETSSKDKEKNRSSSSSTSKDSKSSSNHGESKSKSSSDKNKKSDKSSYNTKHSGSSSSSSSKKDRDKKRDSKKESNDDHYSAKDKKNHRRSTDRDSNDGQSSRQSHSTSFSASSSSSSQKNNQELSNSNSGSGSGDSGNSDQVEQLATKSPVKLSENIENKEVIIPCVDVQKFKYIKPKFASNFQEARKLMKIRKQLARLERQNQLSLAHIEVPIELPTVNGLSYDEADNTKVVDKLENLNEKPNTPEKKENTVSPKEGTPVLQSTDLSKENWEALEARLAQEMSNVNYNSYESPYDDYDCSGYNSITISPKKNIKPFNDKYSLIEERTARNIEGPKLDGLDNEKVPPIPSEKIEQLLEETREEVIVKTEIKNHVVDKNKLKNEQMQEKLYINLEQMVQNISNSLKQTEKQSTVCEEENKQILPDETEKLITNEKETIKEKVTPYRHKMDYELIDTNEAKMQNACDPNEQCRYLERSNPCLEKRLQFIHAYISKLECDIKNLVKPPQNNLLLLKKGRKRKLQENVDLKNNNKAHYEQTTEVKKRRRSVAPNPNSVISKANKEKMCNSTDISPNDSFSLPLSPAESDKSNDKKEESPKSAKQKRNVIGKNTSRSQRYSSDDLYKPRPLIASSRRTRGAKNPEI